MGRVKVIFSVKKSYLSLSRKRDSSEIPFQIYGHTRIHTESRLTRRQFFFFYIHFANLFLKMIKKFFLLFLEEL